MKFDIKEQDKEGWYKGANPNKGSGASLRQRKPFVLEVTFDDETYSRTCVSEPYANTVIAKLKAACRGRGKVAIKKLLATWVKNGRVA